MLRHEQRTDLVAVGALTNSVLSIFVVILVSVVHHVHDPPDTQERRRRKHWSRGNDCQVASATGEEKIRKL